MTTILRRIMLVILAALLTKSINAQTTKPSGWLFLSHSQKLNKKWNYMTDIQLRTSYGFRHLQNILIRPGILYNIAEKQSFGIGYTYFATRDNSESPATFEPENRIFEQYVIEMKTGRLVLNNRIRLEQRFIQKTAGNVFAQRLRHQVQARFRLNADTDFKKGCYIKLQNEIFLNIQHKGKFNNFFDQNRPYAATGFRFTGKLEAEAGYYYRYQLEEPFRKREHIFQLMILTDL